MEECIWRGEGIHPTRVWNEMENMRAELENMFQLASSGNRLLPAGGVTDRMHPALHYETNSVWM